MVLCQKCEMQLRPDHNIYTMYTFQIFPTTCSEKFTMDHQSLIMVGPEEVIKRIYCLLDLSTGVSLGFKDQKSYQRLAITNTMAHSKRRDRQALTEVSSYLIFVIFLHGQNFWRMKFTPKNPNFLP